MSPVVVAAFEDADGRRTLVFSTGETVVVAWHGGMRGIGNRGREVGELLDATARGSGLAEAARGGLAHGNRGRRRGRA